MLPRAEDVREELGRHALDGCAAEFAWPPAHSKPRPSPIAGVTSSALQPLALRLKADTADQHPVLGELPSTVAGHADVRKAAAFTPDGPDRRAAVPIQREEKLRELCHERSCSDDADGWHSGSRNGAASVSIKDAKPEHRLIGGLGASLHYKRLPRHDPMYCQISGHPRRRDVRNRAVAAVDRPKRAIRGADEVEEAVQHGCSRGVLD